jgi:hypothetical protein
MGEELRLEGVWGLVKDCGGALNMAVTFTAIRQLRF